MKTRLSKKQTTYLALEAYLHKGSVIVKCTCRPDKDSKPLFWIPSKLPTHNAAEKDCQHFSSIDEAANFIDRREAIYVEIEGLIDSGDRVNAGHKLIEGMILLSMNDVVLGFLSNKLDALNYERMF